MMIAAGVFGLATAVAKRRYTHTGKIIEVNERERILQVDSSDGYRLFRFRYDEGTEFAAGDSKVVPSSGLNGVNARVLYRKSLLVGEYALHVRLGN